MSSNHDLAYPIVIEESVREPLRTFARERGIAPYAVLCDAQVLSYARDLTRGIPGCLGILAFQLGEQKKDLATIGAILEALVGVGADRDTTIIGVGGGIASDTFGFAAATFMRGVPYVHVATSLVAMVDAAVGGKTGVNLPSGKNLVGRFSDPLAVFAHVRALRTLPYRNMREGLAEIVKMAIIEGGALFDGLETLAPHPFHKWPWETIVSEALTVKTMFVSEDRTERGSRATLNLGHTFGHALERASQYAISHGAGVSIGLRAAGLLALRSGRYSQDEHLRVLALLALLKLPMETSQNPAAVFSAMRADKKRRDGAVRFVLPRAIGDVEYGIKVRDSAVRAVLARLREAPGAREFR